jgi:predicted nucleic acid-binding protein
LGLVDELRGQKVCIDTAPIIYFIEKHEKYLNVLRPLFAEIDAANIEAITSTITLLEVLVQPLRTKNERLAERYRDILLYSEGLTTFEVLHEVSEMASKLRAKYSIKTPDAIQIAIGVLYGANKFLTNDPGLKKVADITVLVLDEFLENK